MAWWDSYTAAGRFRFVGDQLFYTEDPESAIWWSCRVDRFDPLADRFYCTITADRVLTRSALLAELAGLLETRLAQERESSTLLDALYYLPL